MPFCKGDRVRIAASKRHLPGAGMVAKVIGSYADLYPQFVSMPNKNQIYCLEIPGRGNVSWYSAELLTPEDYD